MPQWRMKVANSADFTIKLDAISKKDQIVYLQSASVKSWWKSADPDMINLQEFNESF